VEVKLRTPPPSMSRLSSQCGILQCLTTPWASMACCGDSFTYSLCIVSFLSTMLWLYSEIVLSQKQLGIGHIHFLVRMTAAITSQNIDLSSWDTLYDGVSSALHRNAVVMYYQVKTCSSASFVHTHSAWHNISFFLSVLTNYNARVKLLFSFNSWCFHLWINV
jgi:hypothetical protein